MGLKLVQPVLITDGNLTANSVTEADYPVWSATTAYTASTSFVIYKHVIYQRTVSGTTATTPDADSVNWVKVRATNAWAQFDTSNTTQTTSSAAIVTTIKPGQAVDTVWLSGLSNVSTVRVQMVDPSAGTVYDKTVSLLQSVSASDWFAYFFSPVAYRQQVLFQGLPAFPNASVTVTSAPLAGQTGGVGTQLLGLGLDFGQGIKYGARVGITDYSTKEKNAFGDYVVVQRNWSRRANFEINVDNSQLDTLINTLAMLRTTPCLWIGSEIYECTAIYGYYKTFEGLISYPTTTVFSLEIEGLT